MQVPTRKRKRKANGSGYLYKRDAAGKTHPAEWKGQGNFWLAYYIGGKYIRQRLIDADGNPVTTREAGEAERKRILAPYQTGNDLETLKAIKTRLEDATRLQDEAVAEAKGGIAIASAWDRYLASRERPDTGDATLRQYSFQFNRFARWMQGRYPDVKALDGVTKDHAQDYATDLSTAGLSGNSFNKHVGLLSLVFRVLQEDAGIKVNPWEKIARRKYRGAERRELTVEELRRIITTADADLKLLFAIGIYTGLRLGDCATLRWAEIDFLQRVIVRIPNKTSLKGKPVRIPLFPDLESMLKDMRQSAVGEYVLPRLAQSYQADRADSITNQIQRHFWNCGIDCHASGTGKQIKRDTLGNPVLTSYGNAELVDTGKRAAIRCGFHSLRHTFVSLCRQAGAPLAVVEAIVGHSNPAMTRHYSHTGDAEAIRAIAALPPIVEQGEHDALRQPRPAPPSWVVELVKSMSAKSWKQVKAAILEGVVI